MSKLFFAVTLKRAAGLIAGAGLGVFAAVFLILAGLMPGAVPALAATLPDVVLTAIAAAVIAQAAMSLAWTVLMHRQTHETAQVRTAIESMAQGMCMFDAAERLVVCNSQYSRMYGLSPGDVRPGTTLTEVLEKRVAQGTFARDPHQYRTEFLAEVARGRTITHEVKQKSGRLILVTNHPMTGGGWIGTHEDITDRRHAEQEHLALQQQEERRAAIEDAIAAFRARAESLLRTVTGSADAMRLTAAGLFKISGDASEQTGTAVKTSNVASTSVEAAASAADELSTSIAEIGQRLNQTAAVVRASVDEAQETNKDIDTLAQAAQRIGDVVKLIKDIAEQTNLLALNATIEAARAGDAGRGFAVVASEVKTLAVQTAKATEDIAGLIQEVQNSTGKAVDAIGRIAGRMGEVNTYTSAVAAAVEQQTAATDEISQNVANAAGGAKQIVAVLSEVAGAVAEARQTAQTVLSASEAVEEAAANLRGEVEGFLTRVG